MFLNQGHFSSEQQLFPLLLYSFPDFLCFLITYFLPLYAGHWISIWLCVYTLHSKFFDCLGMLPKWWATCYLCTSVKNWFECSGVRKCSLSMSNFTFWTIIKIHYYLLFDLTEVYNTVTLSLWKVERARLRYARIVFHSLVCKLRHFYVWANTTCIIVSIKCFWGRF